ncbi:MAG: hypothetical protein QNJ51_30745 [Calothrix sp. MO_167.B12]|nr:hypothetical protein [Calothrix sp. MO_167.B12]
MKIILIYIGTTVIFALSNTNLISSDYASAKANKSNIPNVDNPQSTHNNWRLVKQSFRLYLPKNGNALSQIILDTPPTVAVSNDIDVFDDKSQKLNINVSVNGRKIIIDFPETVTSNTTNILISLNKVKQPTLGPVSIYRLSAKFVGSTVEIPVGVARFHTF